MPFWQPLSNSVPDLGDVVVGDERRATRIDADAPADAVAPTVARTRDREVTDGHVL
jgi:hypothetical protein